MYKLQQNQILLDVNRQLHMPRIELMNYQSYVSTPAHKLQPKPTKQSITHVQQETADAIVVGGCVHLGRLGQNKTTFESRASEGTGAPVPYRFELGGVRLFV